MGKHHAPTDCNRLPLVVGDDVVIVTTPEQLLEGLPDEDQTAILAQVGQTLKVSGFDEYGYAEIEFVDAKGIAHTIWIEPRCLLKQGPRPQ